MSYSGSLSKFTTKSLLNVGTVTSVCRKLHSSLFLLCDKALKSDSTIMKVLNVAEKNDAAKNLARLLSNGTSRLREGLSRFNKLYEWNHTLFNQQCKMTMTSVSGHLLALEFGGNFKIWNAVDPIALFDAPINKYCPKDFTNIKLTLEREARGSQILIIWTDGDREGEHIGFEIIDVCKAVRPNLQVYRAKFSEITARSVERAITQLVQPNKNISDAVDVRTELDLRIGAAFTRFQTLRLQRIFPQNIEDAVVSYGSCQFPTLGFVVERYKAVQSFVPEPFWKIKVTHKISDLNVDFNWKRGRLFNQHVCQVYYDICMELPKATVETVQSKPKSKWRPLPLDTVEMEKAGSRKLRINAKEVMKIAEQLYTKGFISYPRTETNIFPKAMDLTPLVQMQTVDNAWGEFAAQVVTDGPYPRAGKKSDQAHPPIHPTKYTNSLQGNDKMVYEFIVRHFLACCSKDAEGLETLVAIDINGEKFTATGLMIIARNYLDVYPYEKWTAKEIHRYQPGEQFQPTSIELVDGETSAPNLLTEADLISLMEKHGIGTDATHAEHIEKIKFRKYVGLENNIYFVPGHLGMGLVEGYDNMGFAMSKPNLRAELESDLKLICDGRKDPAVVLREQVAKYRAVFEVSQQRAEEIDRALANYFQVPNIRPPDNNQGGGFGGGAPPPPPPRPPRRGPPGGGNSPPPPRNNPRNAFNSPPLPQPPRGRNDSHQSFDSGYSSSTNQSRGDNSRFGGSTNQSSHVGSRVNASEQGGGLCKCGEKVVMLSVKKDGPNQGRQFYKCAKRANEGQCSHFEFADERRTEPPQQRTNTTPSYSSTSNNSRTTPNANDTMINCSCGLPAKRLITQKEGPNKGRWFCVCSKKMDDPDKCGFFEWDDNEEGRGANSWAGSTVSGGGQNSWANSTRGGRGQNNSSTAASNNDGWITKKRPVVESSSAAGQPKRRRKCGLCQEEGHNKLKCPRLHS